MGPDVLAQLQHDLRESRAAYLEWLSKGRRNPNTPIGYVFLYFYGLERRILVDCAAPGPLRAELPLLRSEIERLLSIYGRQGSFRGYATRLLSLVDLMLEQRTDTPPVYAGEKWPTPFGLRMALGEFGRAHAPIPAHWALAWALFHPQIYPRTPVTRCADEFTRLFSARYAAKFGPGMLVKPSRSTVTVDYQPASAGLNSTGWDTGLHDVFELTAPAKQLSELIAESTDELDAYSRWLGRYPETRDTLPAIALLPPVLIDAGKEPVSSLLRLVQRRLGSADQAVIDGLDLVRTWDGEQGTKLTKQQSTALAQLLAGQGVGLEPDPRFGGAALGAGPAVLFRADPERAVNTASSAYTAAATVVRLAAAVAAADKSSNAEQDYLLTHLEAALDLSPAELRRLRAHLHLLLSAPVKLTGLTTRLAELQAEEREQIAQLCLAVAAADSTIAPAEVTTLTKIYKLLGLPDARVFQDVHTATMSIAETAAATEPVTVHPAAEFSHSGYLIPAPPAPQRAVQPQPQPRGLGLDRAAISAKLAETAKVSALLGSIFRDEQEAPPQPQPVADDVVLVAGLDAPHSRLLLGLAEAAIWSRAAVEDLCSGLGLLTDGALETLNDAAYERAGDPVVDGGDPLEIDLDVIREMQQ